MSHTPEQNDLAERKHRHISTVTPLLLNTANLTPPLWVEIALTIVFIIDILPSSVFGWSSLYFRLFGHHPNLSSLRTFSCVCDSHLGAYTTDKLEPRTKEYVFVGCNSQFKGYRCLDPDTNRVCISRHVLFPN